MGELKELIASSRVWSQHLEKLCQAIGAGELRYRPMPESNSAAWILVHLMDSYIQFVELAGRRRSEELIGHLPRPTPDQLSLMSFSSIFALLEEYRNAFWREVTRLSEKQRITEACPAGEGQSWRNLVHKVLNNEIYHCGQLAYVARILQQKASES